LGGEKGPSERFETRREGSGHGIGVIMFLRRNKKRKNNMNRINRVRPFLCPKKNGNQYGGGDCLEAFYRDNIVEAKTTGGDEREGGVADYTLLARPR